MRKPSTSFIVWSAAIALAVGVLTPWVRRKLFGKSSNGEQTTPE